MIVVVTTCEINKRTSKKMLDATFNQNLGEWVLADPEPVSRPRRPA